MAVTKTTTITSLAGKLVVDFTANATSSATPNHATNGIPTWQFTAPPGVKTSYAFPDGQDYVAGLSMWCTSNPAHQNVTSPSAAVIVKLVST